MDTLTEKQLNVLNFIKDYTKDKGCQPSSREMAIHFNVSSPAIQNHLNALDKKGYIELTGKPRAVRILK